MPIYFSFFRTAAAGLLLGLALLLAACGADSGKAGVVATVNGQPILLKELEARHDLVNLGWGGQPAITVAALRDQYGAVLSQLIIHSLVAQELKRRELAVTDDELRKAEAQARMDYPPGAFERMLMEEYIDLAVWRDLLRAGLGVEKLMRKGLRAQAAIPPEEVVAHYKANAAEFREPARIRLMHVSGPGRTLVRDAALAWIDNPDAVAIMSRFEKVFLQEMTLHEERLPKLWREDLAGAPPRAATVVRANQSGFECLIPLERLPARQLDLGEAAPLIERQLMEPRMAAAFQAWLDKAVAGADIRVSTHLLAARNFGGNATEEELADQMPSGVPQPGQPLEQTVGSEFDDAANITVPGMPMGEEFDGNASTMEPDKLVPEEPESPAKNKSPAAQ